MKTAGEKNGQERSSLKYEILLGTRTRNKRFKGKCVKTSRRKCENGCQSHLHTFANCPLMI
eukprot:6463643-Amphidinium_carterae.1